MHRRLRALELRRLRNVQGRSIGSLWNQTTRNGSLRRDDRTVRRRSRRRRRRGDRRPRLLHHRTVRRRSRRRRRCGDRRPRRARQAEPPHLREGARGNVRPGLRNRDRCRGRLEDHYAERPRRLRSASRMIDRDGSRAIWFSSSIRRRRSSSSSSIFRRRS